MKAVVLERHGAPEVLVDREFPSPAVGSDEVKIEVRAAGVNFADLLQRMGLYASAPKLPYVPGFEVSGSVSEIGESVTGIVPGDRVLGLAKFGGYAEEICLPVRAVRRLPPSLDYQEAAALPVNYLTAWFCLFSMGNLQPGDRLLVHGGAGGVGVAAIQLALEHPVEIFSTVGSERKKRFLNELGVKHVINYKQIDFTDYIREQTNQEGVEVILDSVGADNLCRSYGILAPMGRLVSYGLSAAAPDQKKSWFQVFRAWWKTPRFTPLQLIGKNVGVFGFHLALLGTKEGLIQDAIDTLLHKVEVGTIRPVISATFQLSAEGVIQAHEYLHERRNMGKVLLVRQGR